MAKQSDKQAGMFEEKEIDVTYVDFDQSLRIPKDTMVFKAQQLQVVLDKFWALLKVSPQQFSMPNYMSALNEYCKIIDELKKGNKGSNDTRTMVDLPGGEQEEMGNGNAPGLVAGISAENPTAG